MVTKKTTDARAAPAAPRYSALDLEILGNLDESLIQGTRAGMTDEAIDLLNSIAGRLVRGERLPRLVELFLASHIVKIAKHPGGPWDVPLLKRTNAQSRHSDEFWEKYARTRAAFLAIERAPWGTKGDTREREAEKLGIGAQELKKRLKSYGFRSK